MCIDYSTTNHCYAYIQVISTYMHAINCWTLIQHCTNVIQMFCVYRDMSVEDNRVINHSAKMNYYESEFATGKQDACFRVINELTQVPGRMLPEASSTKKLCDDF